MGLPPCSWAHLGGISGGEKIYLGSSKIIIDYSTLSAVIGGRDGMDGGRAHWITLPFWEVHYTYLDSNSVHPYGHKHSRMNVVDFNAPIKLVNTIRRTFYEVRTCSD